MSQIAVEQLLGRLLTDPDFRQRFFSSQLESLLTRYALSDSERQALVRTRTALSRDQFERQEALLDPAICRAPLTAAGAHALTTGAVSAPGEPKFTNKEP